MITCIAVACPPVCTDRRESFHKASCDESLSGSARRYHRHRKRSLVGWSRGRPQRREGHSSIPSHLEPLQERMRKTIYEAHDARTTCHQPTVDMAGSPRDKPPSTSISRGHSTSQALTISRRPNIGMDLPPRDSSRNTSASVDQRTFYAHAINYRCRSV
jgi:hypothetical protein